MYYYTLSLRTSSFLMVNSSWTKNHVDSILQHSDILLDAIHMLFPPLLLIKFFAPQKRPQTAKIVYPPCDTREMVKFSLTDRERIILSVAQFRLNKFLFAQILGSNRLVCLLYSVQKKIMQCNYVYFIASSMNIRSIQRTVTKELNWFLLAEVVMKVTLSE